MAHYVGKSKKFRHIFTRIVQKRERFGDAQIASVPYFGTLISPVQNLRTSYVLTSSSFLSDPPWIAANSPFTHLKWTWHASDDAALSCLYVIHDNQHEFSHCHAFLPFCWHENSKGIIL